MTFHSHPKISADASILDGSVNRLLLLFGQLDRRQIDGIVDRVDRALPEPEGPEEMAKVTPPSDAYDHAQRGVLKLLNMIAAQSPVDILFALTYAETLAMMLGADIEEVVSVAS